MKLNDLEFALMNNRVREWSQRTLEAPTLIGGRGALRGLRVLEVGGGRGVGVEILLERFGAAEVVAFDFDPRMVALARERTARFGERAKVFVGDAEHMALANASLDAVVEFGILHHVPNWRGSLAEIARVLKPNGGFYFEDLLKGFVGSLPMQVLFDHPQVTQFTGDEFRTAFAQAGLQLDEDWRQFGEIGLLGKAIRMVTVEVPSPDSAIFRLPLRVHSWYGVNAIVRAAGSMECDIVVEGREFPHPSLVNMFIRRGLPPEARLRLGARHEAGHLQTLPLAALFALMLLAPIVRHPRRLLPRLVAALIGAEAAWELSSEAYVVAKVGTRAYHRAYTKPNSNLALFWLGGIATAITATLVAISEQRQWLGGTR